MNPSHFYIALAIGALAIIALLVFVVRKDQKGKKLTPLAGLALGCVLAGIIFGNDRLIGYSLIGAGVLLAVIDLVKKLKKK